MLSKNKYLYQFYFYMILLVSTNAVLMEVFFPKTATGADSVKIMATWGGDEEAGFREMLDAFKRKTCIHYTYEGSRNVHIILKTRVSGGNPPDVAIIPQYGVVLELARQGVILPLNANKHDPILPKSILEANFSKSFIDLGTINDAFYALTVKANSKSIIWYKPASFRALGVKTPETWQELLNVADAYLKHGKTPYAIGGADGWPLTDWFENIYIRVAGPIMYRKLFLTHEVKWTHPSVMEAMARFREIIRPEKKMAGGSEGTLSTGFIDAFNSFLRHKSAAEMYFEGGFMSSFAEQNFPNLQGGKDYSVFDFPIINPKWGKPVVGGGDLLIVFKDRPQVRKLVRYMAGKEASTIWASAKKGAIVSPNKNVPFSVYSPLKRHEAQQLTDTENFVFDGSDLTPSAVGGDGMVIALQDFVAEPERVRQILSILEEVAARSY